MNTLDCAFRLAAALTLLAAGAGANAAATKDPHIALTTPEGALCIRLHRDAAPDAVAQLVALVEGGRLDGVSIDYTRPRVELRTGDETIRVVRPSLVTVEVYFGPSEELTVEGMPGR